MRKIISKMVKDSSHLDLLTLRSTTVSGMSNSPTIQSGMAPPHGLALSSLRSNMTVSIPFSWAKISAAHAPEGPPPTTATLYFISKAEEDLGTFMEVFPMKEEVEKALAVAKPATATRVNFILLSCVLKLVKRSVSSICKVKYECKDGTFLF